MYIVVLAFFKAYKRGKKVVGLNFFIGRAQMKFIGPLLKVVGVLSFFFVVPTST